MAEIKPWEEGESFLAPGAKRTLKESTIKDQGKPWEAGQSYLIETPPGASLSPTMTRDQMRKHASRVWGWPEQMINATTLGGFKAVAPWATTQGPLDREAARARLDRGKLEYERENPTEALLGEVLPSVVSTTGALRGAGLALGAGGRALTRAMPGLEPIGAFLTGQAGAYGAGMPSALLKATSQATSGAAQGAAGSVLASGLSPEPVGDQAAIGAIVGSLVNPATGLVARGLGSHIDPGVADLGQRWIARGMPLRAGQVPGAAPGVQILDKLFNKGQNPAAVKELTNRVGASFGAPRGPLSEDLIDQLKTVASNEVRSHAGTGHLQLNHPDWLRGFWGLDRKARAELDDVDYKKWETLRDRVIRQRGGSMFLPGEKYKALTDPTGEVSKAGRRGDSLRPYAIELRGLMDDALERANPQAAAGIREARRKYTNALIAEDSIDPTTGLVDPVRFHKGVATRYPSFSEADRVNPPGVPLGTLAEGAEKFSIAPSRSLRDILHELKTNKLAAIGLGSAAAGYGAGVGSGLGEAGRTVLSMATNPSIIPLVAGAGAGYVGARGVNALARSPWWTQRMLGQAQGQPTYLGGTNPLIPGIAWPLNQPEMPMVP